MVKILDSADVDRWRRSKESRHCCGQWEHPLPLLRKQVQSIIFCFQFVSLTEFFTVRIRRWGKIIFLFCMSVHTGWGYSGWAPVPDGGDTPILPNGRYPPSSLMGVTPSGTPYQAGWEYHPTRRQSSTASTCYMGRGEGALCLLCSRRRTFLLGWLCPDTCTTLLSFLYDLLTNCRLLGKLFLNGLC